MLEAPTPDNETQRIKALRALDILDTRPEQRFDRITTIAQHLFGVPIALISLVDTNRQWFKSCQGLSASETSRDISFCGHAINDNSIFYIPDTLEDPRFADNPLVTEPPNIRFYAGAPLTLLDGSRIGTLCIIDSTPRNLTPEQLADLRNLADWAQEEFNTLALNDAMKLIREKEIQLHSILSGITDTVLTVSPDGIVLSSNRALQSMFGLSEKEIVGSAIKNILPDLSISDHLTDLEAATDQRLMPEQELIGLRSDGSHFPAAITLSLMALPEQNAVIVAARDITRRREIEHIKQEFISIVSHELRTPLTSIRGALGLLEGGIVGDLPSKAKDMIKIAHENCERLVYLVNDILDAERLSQGKLSMELKPMQIAPIVKHAVELNQDYATSLGVSIETEICESPLFASIDEQRFIQIMNNLLSNAAKHAPADSSIHIGVAQDGSNVRITVHDKGLGIPPHLQEQLFEKFRQLDTSDNSNRTGSGLGLSIAQGIVEAFNGNIGVESKPGEGSTFFFTLPLAIQ